MLIYEWRFTNFEDKTWFESSLQRVVKEHVDEDLSKEMNNCEPYFVDFLRDPPEPTGEESEDADLDAPKIYEEVRRMSLVWMSLSVSIPRIPLHSEWVEM